MFHRCRWCVLILATLVFISPPAFGKIAGSDNPKVFTEHGLVKAELAFYKRTLSDAYENSGKRDAKWDDAAVKFLDAMAIRLVNAPRHSVYRVADEKSTDELMDL